MSALQPESASPAGTDRQDGTGGACAGDILIVNGSPRGFPSNSRVILSWMFPGLPSPPPPGRKPPPAPGRADVSALDLRTTTNDGRALEAFARAKRVLVVFPLYADSVPGLVKAFIEAVAEAARAGRLSLKDKQLGFVVHSGFPESIQSEACAAYLRRLCARWGCACLGVVIKGGSEGFRLMPANQTKKVAASFARLGADILEGRPFDPPTVAELAHPRVYSKRSLLTLRILQTLKLANLYWLVMLRRHKAWKKRFDQPYADALVGSWQ